MEYTLDFEFKALLMRSQEKVRNAHPEFPVAKDHNDLRAKPLCCRVESC